jgi:hypothetical protein
LGSEKLKTNSKYNKKGKKKKENRGIPEMGWPILCSL